MSDTLQATLAWLGTTDGMAALHSGYGVAHVHVSVVGEYTRPAALHDSVLLMATVSAVTRSAWRVSRLWSRGTQALKLMK